MLFQLTLLYTTTQPHPSASEGEAECIGDIPPSPLPPISPGSGLNWEICGWDSEGRCGGGGGESCFLKFYLPSSSGISAVLCPAFSFVLDGAGHKLPWLTWQGYQCFVCSPIFAVACFVFVSCQKSLQALDRKEVGKRICKDAHIGSCVTSENPRILFAIFLLTDMTDLYVLA